MSELYFENPEKVGPEKDAWKPFQDVVDNIFGNYRSSNYNHLIKK